MLSPLWRALCNIAPLAFSTVPFANWCQYYERHTLMAAMWWPHKQDLVISNWQILLGPIKTRLTPGKPAEHTYNLQQISSKQTLLWRLLAFRAPGTQNTIPHVRNLTSAYPFCCPRPPNSMLKTKFWVFDSFHFPHVSNSQEEAQSTTCWKLSSCFFDFLNSRQEAQSTPLMEGGAEVKFRTWVIAEGHKTLTPPSFGSMRYFDECVFRDFLQAGWRKPPSSRRKGCLT